MPRTVHYINHRSKAVFTYFDNSGIYYLTYLNDNGLLVVEVGNSWRDLEELYPGVPFTWLEFANGGHGVFALSAKELQQFSTSFMG